MCNRLLQASLYLFLVLLSVISCTTPPSNQEIISTISEKIRQDSPCKKIENLNLEVDKIGYKQSSDSIDWWPIRINAIGKCIGRTNQQDFIPFNGNAFNQTNEEVVDTIIIEYRLLRNEYGEWEAKIKKIDFWDTTFHTN